jgi:hypothetical protein
LPLRRHQAVHHHRCRHIAVMPSITIAIMQSIANVAVAPSIAVVDFYLNKRVFSA